MAKRNYHPDSAGIEAVLMGSAVRAAVRAVADAVAAAALASCPAPHSDEVEVFVNEYTARGGRMRGNRPAFSVVLAHPGSMGLEGRYGVLRNAARAGGAK